jgi:hypothetical protein
MVYGTTVKYNVQDRERDAGNVKRKRENAGFRPTEWEGEWVVGGGGEMKLRDRRKAPMLPTKKFRSWSPSFLG